MFRFLPRGFIENANMLFNSLLPWQQLMILIMGIAALCLFLLGGLTLGYKIKRFNAGSIILLTSVLLVLFIFLTFISFSIADSCGWLRGSIAFFALPLSFIIAILSGYYILIFCVGFSKRDWNAWVGLVTAIVGMASAAVILALTLQNCN